MAKFNPGTYEGSGRGYGGKLFASVTVSEDRIEQVKITQHKEYRGIGWGLNTTPMELFPGLIVEYQSLNIPTVVGADLTAAAILEAVAAALTAAGASKETLAEIKAAPGPKAPDYKDEVRTLDVVVCGAGAGGLAAAIEAKLAGAEVVIVEKQGVTGGSTARSGGKLLGAGTKWQKKQGLFDTPEMVYDYLMEVGNRNGDFMDKSKNRYLTDHLNTPFPMMPYTQRPDRFCQGLLEGRVGVMADGLPFAWLLPGTIDQFFKTGQDRAFHWMTASALNLIRWFCAVITVLVPGLYIALVTFHPEAIPVKLALSIAAAKQEVPFSTVFEVLIMLLAFEVLQEAGLRLPSPIGATVSILGGLVVGNAAVEAHIVSPAVLIAVAIAGVAGYTMPSQDFASALRLWRFLLAIAASIGGLFGLAAGCAALIYHLAGLETFGVPYLAPFTNGAGQPRGHPSLLRLPLPRMKWRDGAKNTKNRRNQR